MIEVIVNGRPLSIEAGLTLATLLERLELPIGRIAVERNEKVVPRARYAAEPVEAGDRLEVVTLVGGG